MDQPGWETNTSKPRHQHSRPRQPLEAIPLCRPNMRARSVLRRTPGAALSSPCFMCFLSSHRSAKTGLTVLFAFRHVCAVTYRHNGVRRADGRGACKRPTGSPGWWSSSVGLTLGQSASRTLSCVCGSCQNHNGPARMRAEIDLVRLGIQHKIDLFPERQRCCEDHLQPDRIVAHNGRFRVAGLRRSTWLNIDRPVSVHWS